MFTRIINDDSIVIHSNTNCLRSEISKGNHCSKGAEFNTK